MTIFIIQQNTLFFQDYTKTVGYFTDEYEAQLYVQKMEDLYNSMKDKLSDLFSSSKFTDYENNNPKPEDRHAYEEHRQWSKEKHNYFLETIKETLTEDEFQLYESLVEFVEQNSYRSSSWYYEKVEKI